jgi:putative ABC transport system ATP-binding protein
MSAAMAQAGEPGVTAVLELDAVSKIYPSQPPVVALRGVSLTVQPGELLAVVGPSGSGKTTLLHLMGTLDRPSSGTVRVIGQDVAALSDRDLAALRATSIGFVFQQFFLNEHATALDNIADGLLYAGVGLAERRELALEALRLVGLAERPQARPTQLSGGQRQRVAIARALVNRPAVLLADEPTGAVDTAVGRAIGQLLLDLNEAGQTLLIVTHNPELAERYASRVIQLADGRVVSDTGAAGHGEAAAAGQREPGAQP